MARTRKEYAFKAWKSVGQEGLSNSEHVCLRLLPDALADLFVRLAYLGEQLKALAASAKEAVRADRTKWAEAKVRRAAAQAELGHHEGVCTCQATCWQAAQAGICHHGGTRH